MSGLEDLVERAFDYRGFVTLSRRDGSQIVGYVYDRGPSHVELFEAEAGTRVRLPIADLAHIELTGEDSAAHAQEVWERRRGKLEPAATPAWGDRSERPVLVLTALHGELVSGTDGSVLVRALGVGGGAAHVIEELKPRVVISCGFAGGLDASATPDRVVLATAVSEELGDTLVAHEGLRTAARDALFGLVVEGEIVCATRICGTPEDKRALARPGRLAVDLESWAIARAAERAGIPWLAVRVAIDPFDVALPPFAREPRTSYFGPALRHALRGPAAARELLDLAQRARRARRTLGIAMRRIGRVLAEVAP
jgi:adenosylhomocysteine nucleosidase